MTLLAKRIVDSKVFRAIIIAVMLIRFLSKRGNRHPMAGQRERNIDEIRRDGPKD